ncbi:hypothetical protein EYC80_002764 [Monilinia laxa]|uniref:Uncharacterized protein n=1 Tax=Monilinia laxa TaxID=61186 RepID=A0A5N6KBN5_MONLA|nr:hypothetical protein EYC80_002764 [Monilinia laxa]
MVKGCEEFIRTRVGCSKQKISNHSKRNNIIISIRSKQASKSAFFSLHHLARVENVQKEKREEERGERREERGEERRAEEGRGGQRRAEQRRAEESRAEEGRGEQSRGVKKRNETK